ncbi:ABC transporter ATP-binding protein [Actinosynnema sp. ALI-1.44]|uniref:ATP-binding cassette domain-containing protein n=1 Tax=Actinosynnema sp. ALI-1.44 TaxID=1933779 RepID=UPI00097BDDFD|nr:ATP-binding cassette domain-containing protein [Actinosynnema sp. ALI-1.44]ONI81289.1 ABC transporter ATP-binding protein [Actinosynnema sp. ALI-1.44]
MVTAELRDLTVHIDTGQWSETVLAAVNLTVPEGQMTALLGESGCGKSMIAAALTGRLPASAQITGQVHINDAHVQDQRQWRQLRGHTIGLVPQSGATAFTAADPVGAQLLALERSHQRWTVDRACAAARYPVEAFDLYPQQHSSGQIQRAALAAALLPEPDLLIADEPTASLDTATAYEVWGTLREYADAGAAVLAITQEVPLLTAIGVADRMVFMRDGRITVAGPATEIPSLADPYVQGFFQEIGQ